MRLRGLRVMRIPIRHIYGPLRNLWTVIITTYLITFSFLFPESMPKSPLSPDPPYYLADLG